MFTQSITNGSPLGFVYVSTPCWSPRCLVSHSRKDVYMCASRSPRTQGPAIAVRNVSFWWPNGRAALQDVSLEVFPGELSMIVGYNGSGKSTLLKVIRGLLNPTTGDVYLQKPCAFVFQDPDVQIVMPSIGTDIALSVPKTPTTTDAEIREAVVDALNAVGLTPPENFMRMNSSRISGGQRQRVVVAAALAMQPITILFDEVTASMDPINKAELITRVRKTVSERSIAGLWVTHLLDELDFADTIVIMDSGRVVAKGPRVAMMPLIFDMQDAI